MYIVCVYIRTNHNFWTFELFSIFHIMNNAAGTVLYLFVHLGQLRAVNATEICNWDMFKFLKIEFSKEPKNKAATLQHFALYQTSRIGWLIILNWQQVVNKKIKYYPKRCICKVISVFKLFLTGRIFSSLIIFEGSSWTHLMLSAFFLRYKSIITEFAAFLETISYVPLLLGRFYLNQFR